MSSYAPFARPSYPECAKALRWMCAEDVGEELRFGCAGTLAAAPGDAGWRVAAAWLGELLVHLSRQVQAYHSIRQVRFQRCL